MGGRYSVNGSGPLSPFAPRRKTARHLRRTIQPLKRPPPVWSFNPPMPDPDPTDTARAPEPFRAALAELVQTGMSVARMIGHAAEAEAALAKAASTANIADGVSPLATSLAEAIASDQAAAAAGEARRAVITRTQIVAAAFNQTARAIRRTIHLAERLDRGWGRPHRGRHPPHHGPPPNRPRRIGTPSPAKPKASAPNASPRSSPNAWTPRTRWTTSPPVQPRTSSATSAATSGWTPRA